MGALLAAAGGAAVGGAAFALDGQDMTNRTKAAAVGLGGLALGIGISGFNEAIGAGVAGAGVALATKMVIEEVMAGKAATDGLGYIPGYAYNKFGPTPGVPAYRNLPNMGAVQAQLNGGLGAVVYDMNAVTADIGGDDLTMV